MHAAMRRGFLVSKPFGDSAGYDVIVDSAGPRGGGRLWRVQVKSLTHEDAHGGFRFPLERGKQRAPMRVGDADFLAALVVPLDLWYIVPLRHVLPRISLTVFPHRKNSRARAEPYREAWHLLKRHRLPTLPNQGQIPGIPMR